MGDLTGKLAGKPKTSGSRFRPTTHGVFRRSSVKRRIHFNGGEIVGIKLQPMGLRQIVRIKDTAPVFEAPRARADADFLLVDQIQTDREIIRFCPAEKISYQEEKSVLKT